MKSEVIHTAKAPLVPGAHYAQAIRAGQLLFVGGVVPRDPETHQLLHVGDFEAQARQTFEYLGNILDAAGTPRNSVVQLRAFYTDAKFRPIVGEIRDSFFSEEPYPTVTSVVCELVYPELLIEVDAIAVIPE